jgi:6-phosphofructokinase 1
MARIAVLEAGGGAPGADAAARSAARAAAAAGSEAFGVPGGFDGLLSGAKAPLGGGSLGAGRSAAMKEPGGPARAAEALRALGADGLLVLGGEGSLQASAALAKAGARVAFVAATVENDVAGTEACLGVDTALNAILRRCEAVQGPAILEVPGRLTGYLALVGAAGAGAAGALVVERPFPWDRLGARLAAGARPLLLCAEGAGAAKSAEARLLALLPGTPPRVESLGEALRAEPPSIFDRLAAIRLGEAAVEWLLAGMSGAGAAGGVSAGRMIAWRLGSCIPVPLEEVAGRRRQVVPEVFELAKKMEVLFE